MGKKNKKKKNVLQLLLNSLASYLTSLKCKLLRALYLKALSSWSSQFHNAYYSPSSDLHVSLAHSVVCLSDMFYQDKEYMLDLRFWAYLLNNWNGISFFYKDVSELSATLKLFTDTASSLGFGVFFQGHPEKLAACCSDPLR